MEYPALHAIPGTMRTYVLELDNTIPPPALEFFNYANLLLTGGRKPLRVVVNQTERNGTMEIEMRCWSCGKNGPMNFTRALRIKFPNIAIRQFTRVRNNNKVKTA